MALGRSRMREPRRLGGPFCPAAPGAWLASPEPLLFQEKKRLRPADAVLPFSATAFGFGLRKSRSSRVVSRPG